MDAKGVITEFDADDEHIKTSLLRHVEFHVNILSGCGLLDEVVKDAYFIQSGLDEEVVSKKQSAKTFNENFLESRSDDLPPMLLTLTLMIFLLHCWISLL